MACDLYPVFLHIFYLQETYLHPRTKVFSTSGLGVYSLCTRLPSNLSRVPQISEPRFLSDDDDDDNIDS